ncbi:cation transporter [Methanosalsum zhilinae DSM 4017]|uniref:Cation transporter n=1 Tax=Methanosalsum zhilinae (strain DSM 4017 / NBRC 107636 / OCM 62 / WeN5) TaxID=679901 RepID=F7XPL7_METZD|nr:TrkH family potassium uptake protein [Methanosalsum zhilinae]AEH61449.1 cation transporter [Methanosalsum zhilinae DSM 4017]
MDFRVVLNVMGRLLGYMGFFMIIPLVLAIHYQEPLEPFLVAIVLTSGTGLFLFLKFRSAEEWHIRESFAIVALTWLSAAVFGTIPYILSGISPVDALFESMSGITATGASILTEIEQYPKSLLFWRNMTQWLGGMGIILLFIAILPKLGVGGRELFKAELPGPGEDKIKPRIRDTARVFWMIYIVFSVVLVGLLMLAGLSPYDSVTHMFTTIACAGFSPYSESIGAFQNPLAEWIIIVFMFIGGVHFALYYRTVFVNSKSLVRDEEFRFYAFILLAATVLLTVLLWRDFGGSLTDSLRYAAFQSISITTTTGYASMDFNQWSDSARMVLLVLMFFGGSAGSTAGGIKMVRILLLSKYARRELFKTIHPRAVKPLRFNEATVTENVIQSIMAFIVIYFLIFVIGSILMALMGLDILSAISASVATLGNVGPGLGMVGPMEGYGSVPSAGKLILTLNMWIGRLEIFTVLVLLTPEFWKNR